MNVVKILISRILLFALIIFAAGCREEIPQTVTSVMLDETSLVMIIGSSQQLSAVVLPESIEPEIEWTSTDTLVAVVSSDGHVSAINEGQCRIWARSGAFMAVCDVYVSAVPAESITLNMNNAEMHPGERLQLSATINMQEVRSGDILKWHSSAMNVAVIDSTGMLTAIDTGHAVISAEFMGVTAECMIKVIDIPVSEIRLQFDKLSLFVGESSTIGATVLPINAGNREISWTTSDASVVSVSEHGEITALAAGQASITAECGGLTEQCSVTVMMPDAKVGDYYYSDGTWSSELNGNKQVIGVVFWVGDPSFNDNALKSEHPDCKHGLVIALNETESKWQEDWNLFGSSIDSWITSNTDYAGIATGTNMGDPLNTIIGYNNTCGIEAFHTDPSNDAWPVLVMQYIMNYREEHPAPETSSDWYLPSIKELSLLITGIYDNNIYNIGNNTSNRPFINERLSSIQEASLISESKMYHSSSENLWSYTYQISNTGMLMAYDKSYSCLVRAVLAF